MILSMAFLSWLFYEYHKVNKKIEEEAKGENNFYILWSNRCIATYQDKNGNKEELSKSGCYHHKIIIKL
jgi:hypothetical protein